MFEDARPGKSWCRLWLYAFLLSQSPRKHRIQPDRYKIRVVCAAGFKILSGMSKVSGRESECGVPRTLPYVVVRLEHFGSIKAKAPSAERADGAFSVSHRNTRQGRLSFLGKDHGIDHVNHAVRAFDVGLDNVGTVDLHTPFLTLMRTSEPWTVSAFFSFTTSAAMTLPATT